MFASQNMMEQQSNSNHSEVSRKARPNYEDKARRKIAAAKRWCLQDHLSPFFMHDSLTRFVCSGSQHDDGTKIVPFEAAEEKEKEYSHSIAFFSSPLRPLSASSGKYISSATRSPGRGSLSHHRSHASRRASRVASIFPMPVVTNDDADSREGSDAEYYKAAQEAYRSEAACHVGKENRLLDCVRISNDHVAQLSACSLLLMPLEVTTFSLCFTASP